MAARSKKGRARTAPRFEPQDNMFDGADLLPGFGDAVAVLVRRNGGVRELIAELFRECESENRQDDLTHGYVVMLHCLLGNMTVDAGNGDEDARRELEQARRAVDDAIEAYPNAAPGTLVLVGRCLAQAGLTPPASLHRAITNAAERYDGEAPDPAALSEHFADIADDFGHNPFAIHADLLNTAAAFPPEHLGKFAALLAHSDVASMRQAAVGFVLAADRATADETARHLAEADAHGQVPAITIARLVRLRPWIAEPRRDSVDAAIRSLRRRSAAPEKSRLSEGRSYRAIPPDGAGASGIFLMGKRGGRFVFSSLLLKADAGVTDAYVRDGLTKREWNEAWTLTATQGGAMPASCEFIERRVADALAVSLERDVPPPFGLIDAAETFGLGSLQPQKVEAAALAAELLAGLAAERTDARAAGAAHAQSLSWVRRISTIETWFETGPEVKRLLAPLKSRKQCLSALVEGYLPQRRERWASQCAWTAALLKEQAADGDLLPMWTTFALVARDIAGSVPLSEIPLMTTIAEATLDAWRA